MMPSCQKTPAFILEFWREIDRRVSGQWQEWKNAGALKVSVGKRTKRGEEAEMLVNLEKVTPVINN